MVVTASAAQERVSVECARLARSAIVAYACNSDGSRLAAAHGCDVVIYARNGRQWREEARLSGVQEQRVTAVDWTTAADGTERVLTASADRNAYVWSSRDGRTWSRTLVLLRLKRAATCARWSPDGSSIAVGSAEGVVSVGTYEAESDWWACRHVKRALDGSSVLALAWHPDGRHIAVTTLSGKMCVVSAAAASAEPSGWSAATSATFDTAVLVYGSGVWMHDVAFSPTGAYVACAGHDGNVHVSALPAQPACDAAAGDAGRAQELPAVRVPIGEPVRRIAFLASDAVIAAAGFDCLTGPALIHGREARWELACRLAPSDTAGAGRSSGAVSGAFAKFRALDETGRAETCAATASSACHTCGVSEMRVCNSSNGVLLTTTGFDGSLALWTTLSLSDRLRVSSL